MSDYLERHERSLREFDIAEAVLFEARQLCLLAETRTLRELGSGDDDTVDADEHYRATLTRCRRLLEIETELESMRTRMRLELGT